MRSPDLRMCTLALSLFAALTTPTWGDVVVTNQGRRMEGQVVRETSAGITLRLVDGSEVIIPNSNVRTIERADRWENLVQAGEQLMNTGHYHDAIEQFEQALQAEPTDEGAALIRERLAAAQDGLAATLQQNQEANEATINDLLTRAEEQVAANNFEDALTTIDGAERLVPSAEQEARIHQMRADTLYARAYSLKDRLDTPGALAALEQLFVVEPTHQQGLDLYRDIVEDQPLDSAEQVAEIEAIVAQNPDRYDLHARLGEYYSRQRDNENALPHLLAASNSELHAAQVRGRLRQAMISQVEEATQAGDYQRAIELYEDVLARFPEEDEGYLNLLIYHYQDNQLAADDLDGRIRLAVQCKQAGYTDWARDQMTRVLAQNPNHPGALELQRQFAQEAFDQASVSLREQNFAVAQMQFQRLIEQYNYPDLVEQAQLLMADAQRRTREESRMRGEQAQALVERGDEYYATAQRNLDFLRQFQFRERQTFTVRGISTRETIVTNLQRAVDCYETALQLDPALGPLSGGGVSVKLADARDLLATFTNPRFPRREPQFSRNN